MDPLRSHGDFAAASAKFKFVGWSEQKLDADGNQINPGSSLPALAFERRDWALLADMQDDSKSDDQRQALAKEHGVHGAFAFFRDGAVFEFGGADTLDQDDCLKIIAQFGGTRGPVVEDASSLDVRAKRPWQRRSSNLTPGRPRA